jgi:tetratricopeptide (TPR) repeat protein
MAAPAELERAASLLGQQKFSECVAVCAAIVAAEPRNAVATHLLGLAIKETGDWAQGEQWLRQSIQLEPQRAEFHANLANLLRRRQKYRQAEKFYRQALQLAPNHQPSRRGLVLTLHDLGRFEESEPLCRELISFEAPGADDWILWGLTTTHLGRLGEAESAYRRAIAVNPNNPIAHQNLGAVLSQLEQPAAALASLRAAEKLGAGGFATAFNRARALLEMNDITAAEREFERAVTLEPSNIEGQLQLARVRFMQGDPAFVRSLNSAVLANRGDRALQSLLAEVLWRSGDLNSAETVLRDLLSRHGPSGPTAATLATVLQEAGRLEEAETLALEAAAAAPKDAVVLESLVSIMLSLGNAAEALPFIQTYRARMPDSQAWIAYEATAARLLGHERYPLLYDYDRFVQVFDLEAPPGWSSLRELNEALIQSLGRSHSFRNHPLDQSLRHGTQTARSLLQDPDPAVRAILQAFEAPIEEYRRRLGRDLSHPLTMRNDGSTRSRFTGAWSVRLKRLGHHVNHFHPDGWISSAYYVEVPPETADATARSGWIKFGEPRYEVPGATAERLVQPAPGRLVLFPSYMWHGTTAIHGDSPRMSIAFDVKPGSD